MDDEAICCLSLGNADNMYQRIRPFGMASSSGQKTLHLAELLQDSFFEAIFHLNTYLAGGRRRENFVRDFTLMLEYVVSNPTEILNDWIPKFFANTGDEDRVRFGQNVSSRIKRMEDAQQRALWDNWLGRYIESRLQGVPAPLSSGEVGAILGWLPHFTSLFPDAVRIGGEDASTATGSQRRSVQDQERHSLGILSRIGCGSFDLSRQMYSFPLGYGTTKGRNLSASF